MRQITAIALIAATSAWADDRPLTWEPARIVRLEEAVASGVLAPTDPHPAFFDFFSDAILESDGSVVFIANGVSRGVSVLGREGVYAIDRDGRPSILVQRGDISENGRTAVESIAALEMHDGTPVARCNLQDGSTEIVALAVDAATKTNWANFSAKGSAGITKEDSRAIYLSDGDNSPKVVVDTATKIPELFGGTFTSFGNRAIASGAWLFFSGSAESYKGLFAMNMQTNRLYLLLDNAASLGDRRIEDFQIGASPRSGSDLAVTVTFADGGSGIYIFRFADSEGNLLFGS